MRIKLFYHPAAIEMKSNDEPPQKKMTLTKQNGKYVANNPTPYYVTIVDVGNLGVEGFKPVIVPPNGSLPLTMSSTNMSGRPVLTYVNDSGSQLTLSFSCSGNTCTVAPETKGH